MRLPFRLNMITIVKSKAIKVIGDISGTNLFWNQSSLFSLISAYLLMIPIAKGSPKYIPTDLAISPIVIFTSRLFKPK
ncbi:hypothetical protein D9M68_802290 [compost metagenome]